MSTPPPRPAAPKNIPNFMTMSRPQEIPSQQGFQQLPPKPLPPRPSQPPPASLIQLANQQIGQQNPPQLSPQPTPTPLVPSQLPQLPPQPTPPMRPGITPSASLSSATVRKSKAYRASRALPQMNVESLENLNQILRLQEENAKLKTSLQDITNINTQLQKQVETLKSQGGAPQKAPSIPDRSVRSSKRMTRNFQQVETDNFQQLSETIELQKKVENLSNELQDTKAKLKKTQSQLDTEISTSSELFKRTKERLDELRKQKNNLLMQLKMNNVESNELMVQKVEELQNQLHQEKTTFVEEVNTLNTVIRDTKSTVATLTEENNDLKEKNNKLEANEGTLLTLVSEYEKQIKTLEGQLKAEKVKGDLSQRELDSYKEKVNDLRNKLTESDRLYHLKVEENEKNKEGEEKLRVHFDSQLKEILFENEKIVSEKNEEIQTLNERIHQNDKYLSENAKKILSLETEKNQLEESLDSQKKIISEKDIKIENLKSQTEQLNSQIQSLIANSGSQDQLTSIQNTLDKALNELSETKESSQILQQDKEILEATLNSHASQVSELKAKVEEFTNLNIQSANLLTEYENKIKSWETYSQSLQSIIDSQHEKTIEDQNTINKLQETISIKENQISSLQLLADQPQDEKPAQKAPKPLPQTPQSPPPQQPIIHSDPVPSPVPSPAPVAKEAPSVIEIVEQVTPQQDSQQSLLDNPLPIEELVRSHHPNDQYANLQKIADGSSGGETFLAYDQTLQGDAIVKIKHYDATKSMAFGTEFIVCSQKNNNIVAFYDSFLVGDQVWMSAEYMSAGNLTDIVSQPTEFFITENMIAYICREVLGGLSFLHKHHIIHRDIKSDQILFSVDGDVKLDVSEHIVKLTKSNPTESRVAGTTYWMAPEVIQSKPYDTKIDLWSLGITIYEMLEGQPPYMEFPPMRALFLISTRGIPPLKNPENSSKLLLNFVSRCLDTNPSTRATADELLNDPFIATACDRSEISPLLVQVKAFYDE